MKVGAKVIIKMDGTKTEIIAMQSTSARLKKHTLGGCNCYYNYELKLNK